MTKSIILIVDDVEANRLTLEDLLDVPEIELHAADDGHTALAIAASLHPDLILLDVMMPDMDGYEVCARMRADPKLADVPIVMVTALDDRDSRVRGFDAGADDFISKPFDRTELRSRVRGILRLNRFRRLAEATDSLRQQAELIDLAPDAIIVCDLGQRITLWNPAAERLYGWSAKEAIGQRADFLLAKQDPQAPVDASSDEWRCEIVQMTRDEKEITVDSRGKMLRDINGAPKAILTINTDLTEKKELESQFLRAQRLESIGTLASGIAHDLNNALSPSLMSIDLLRGRLTEKDDVSLIDMLEESTHRGARLVRQILGFARGCEGKKSDVQLHHLVSEMRRMLIRTFPSDIEIKVEFAGEIWPVKGNATQLDQVLMNLCVNARDAMPEGGKLTISLENITLTPGQCAKLSTMQPGPCVILTVTDTGSGMTDEVREKIFEPFFTTKDLGKGTGLGLSTVFGVVKGHSGCINVTSEVGSGTRFQVYLPAIVHAPPARVPDSAAQKSPAGNGEWILLVDDETNFLRATGAILERLGYRILFASDGIGALALFTEHCDKIRLVLTDFMMPHINGYQIARAIRLQSPELPILLMTGILNKPLPEDGSIIQRLQKPFTADVLLDAVRRALDSATGACERE